MFGCKRRCRKCCPNGCCGFCKPPPQIQQQVDTIIDVKKVVTEKDTPYGRIHIFPGVRTSENTYTSPMLSVQLYRHSQHKSDIAQDKRTISVYRKNEQGTHQGPQEFKRQDKTNVEEEIFMLPIEDVTAIVSKLETKRGIEADVTSETIPTYGLSENCCDQCCDSIKMCCRKTCDRLCCCCDQETKVAPLVRNTTIIFSGDDPNRNTEYREETLALPKEKKGCLDRCRCWCCRKKKLTSLIRKTKVAAERQAQRVITVTIEYSKYSNLDTPSNTRLLNRDDQLAYYKEKFQAHKELKFYLTNNTEFDSTNFELKRQEAETLCRTIMQLKAMKNHYPSERQLVEILDQAFIRSFGDVYAEPTLQISLDTSRTLRRDLQTQELSQLSQRPAIQQPQHPVSARREEAKTTMSETNLNKDEEEFE